MSRRMHSGVQGESDHGGNVLRQVQEESHCGRQDREERDDIQRKTYAKVDMP
jgi:hypothetical protein